MKYVQWHLTHFLFISKFLENRWNEVESQQIQPFVCYATVLIRQHNSYDEPTICYRHLRIMKDLRVLALNREHFNGAKKVKCRKIYYLFWAIISFLIRIFDVWRLESFSMGSKTLYLYLLYSMLPSLSSVSSLVPALYFISFNKIITMIIFNYLKFLFVLVFLLCDLKNFDRNIYLVRIKFLFPYFLQINEY